jgi:hypothetical protein
VTSLRPPRSSVDALADATIAQIARKGRDHVLASERKLPIAPCVSSTMSIAPRRPSTPALSMAELDARRIAGSK